ncbi:MAG TPA: YdcF family protein [Rudaea sp.]
MILTAVLVLLICAFVLARRRRRFAAVLAGLGFVILVLAGSGIPSSILLGDLQAPFAVRSAVQWGSNNAIVVLGVGTAKIGNAAEASMFAYGRLLRARELYEDCKPHGRCRIYVSGGDPQKHGASEAAVYAAELVKAGIDRADLVLDEASRNTWENAKFTRALLERAGADHVVLVTAAVHMRRSLLYFAHFGIAPDPVRADAIEPELSLLPNDLNLAYCDIALHEYIGIARFRIYNAFGWNEAALTALRPPADAAPARPPPSS